VEGRARHTELRLESGLDSRGVFRSGRPAPAQRSSRARRGVLVDANRAPWRDLPEEFGNWNSVFRQFRRAADSGVWNVILEALAGSIRSRPCSATISCGRWSRPFD
jgi:transposase